jgi:methylmalonyl-CoA epimerase
MPVTDHIRRLDHIAIAVHSTDEALRHFRDRLGLRVTHTEDLEAPRVRLTYLDAGNVFLQLVEALDDESEIARMLATRGEGVHHICFGVDDPLASARALSTNGLPVAPGTGRGRVSAFAPGDEHGVRIEYTDFHRDVDVDLTPGWLEPAEQDDR